MKRIWMLVLVFAMLIPAFALAGGETLLMELPQDAQLIENVEFDDGDFIRTYQLSSGGSVQLLRYADFSMPVEELAASEYPALSDLRALDIQNVGGRPASGLRFTAVEEGQAALDVTLICVHAGDAALIYKAAFPQTMGEDAIETLLSGMLATMDVSSDGEEIVDETAEVG